MSLYVLPPVVAVIAISTYHHASMAEQSEALGRHLQDCRAQRGRWFGAALWAEGLHQRLAPRFVTTLVGATAALTLVLLVAAAAGGL